MGLPLENGIAKLLSAILQSNCALKKDQAKEPRS